MGFLRKTENDEGCDSECRYCGHFLLTGPCHNCEFEGERCAGCASKATETHAMEANENGKITVDLIFMCKVCADYAYENQNDDANTP